MRRLLLVFLLAFLATRTSEAEIVPIPQEAPAELEDYRPEVPPQCAGPIVAVTAVAIATCLIIYIYKEEADPYDAHVFSLMRDSYDGKWEAVAWITVAVTPRRAKALFADHIESGSGYRYRVIDWGSVNQWFGIDNCPSEPTL